MTMDAIEIVVSNGDVAVDVPEKEKEPVIVVT